MGRGVEGLLKVERRERNLKEWNKGQSLDIKIDLFLALFLYHGRLRGKGESRYWEVRGEEAGVKRDGKGLRN